MNKFTILLVSLSFLLIAGVDAREPCTDSIFTEVSTDTVIVHHTGAYYNCCAYIEYTISQEDTVIDLIEAEKYDSAGPCDCLCCFDLSVTITDLDPGTYVMKVWNEDQTVLYGEASVTIEGISIGEIAQSDCIEGTETGSGKPEEPCTDSVFAETLGDTLMVYHTGAFYNCCAIVEFTLQEEDTIINIIETETFGPEGPCYCMCCFDLSVGIVGLPPDDYLVRVWNEDQTVLHGEVQITIPGRKASPTIGEVVQSECVNLFVRGDTDESHGIAMADALYILRYLYIPGTTLTCLDSADSDDDGEINMSDGIYILRYLYVPGSSPPLSPFPGCGFDPTLDGLGCEFHPCGI